PEQQRPLPHGQALPSHAVTKSSSSPGTRERSIPSACSQTGAGGKRRRSTDVGAAPDQAASVPSSSSLLTTSTHRAAGAPFRRRLARSAARSAERGKP